MKFWSLLIFLWFCIASHYAVVAQCAPNPSLFTVPGIEPDTMPQGYANNYYEEVVHFMLPLDTQTSLGTYAYQNFEIVSLVGMPIGLNWECNLQTNGCNYDPAVNQYGCLKIYGTPVQVGSFDVIVNINATLSVGVYPTTMISPITINPDTSSGGGFNADVTSACLPLTVNFTNNNPGLMFYDWNFGNGNVSNLENPGPQIYNQEGDYIVSYKAWSDTNYYYILNSIEITSIPDQSNYGTFVNDWDPDLYIILYDNNNTTLYQSDVVDDTQPPITFNIPNLNLSNSNYEVRVWDKDSGFFGLDPDDSLGVVSFNGYGGSGSASVPFSGGGNTAINYTVTTIPPNMLIETSDTINVFGYPPKPNIDSNSTTVFIDSVYFQMQWYLNGVMEAGANGSYHTPTNTGYYHIVVKDENGCETASDSIFIIVCNYFFSININVNGNTVWTDSTQYNYQWYYEGTLINGATNDTYIADTSGYYYVVAYDSFGCQTNSNVVFVDLPQDTTGIEDIYFQQSHIDIFPNPSSDIFKLHFKIPIRSNNTYYELYDHRGTLVRMVKLGRIFIDDIHNLDVRDLSNGVYFLKLTMDKGHITKKLIKY